VQGFLPVLVPYSKNTPIKNKKNLNHRGHREHRGKKSIPVSSVLSVVRSTPKWIEIVSNLRAIDFFPVVL
jgi:hypothetical protein